MNAQSPMTPAAILNGPVLRALDQAETPPTTHLEVAAAADVPAKNMKRTLASLIEDGLVADGDGGGGAGYRLTGEGRRALAAIDVWDGRLTAGGAEDAPAPNDVLLLAHHQIRANPLNARRLDLENPDHRRDLDGLKSQIVAAGDVLQNLVVFPADAEGAHRLFAGERRWTAVGELIAEGQWPTDRPLRAIQRDNTPGQTAFISLVENSQVPLAVIERARAYRDLCADTGWSAREAALRTGWDVKSVQQYLQVLRKAEPAHLAAHEAGDPAWKWETLRDSVKEKAEDATEPEQLDVAEQAAFNWALQLIRDYDAAIRASDDTTAANIAELYDGVVRDLNGGQSFDSHKARQRVAEACRAADGDLPMWGQHGRFLIEINGIRTVVESKGSPNCHTLSGQVEFRAFAPEAPFFSSTGFYCWMGARGPTGVAEAAVRHAVWRMAQKDSRPGPIDPSYVDRERPETWANLSVKYPPNAWLEPPPAAVKTAKAPHIGGDAGVQAAGPPREPAAPAVRLEPVERVAMIELAHLVETDPDAYDGPGVPLVRCTEYWLDQTAIDLKALGLVMITHLLQGGPYCGLSPAGRDWVAANFPDLGQAAMAAERQALNGDALALDEFVTPWLRRVTTPIPAPRPSPPPPLADEDRQWDGAEEEDDPAAEAAEILAKVQAGISTGLFGPQGSLEFRDLLETAGLAGPFETTDIHPGVVFTADDNDAATVDVNGELADDLARARAELVAFCLNAFCGFSTKREG